MFTVNLIQINITKVCLMQNMVKMLQKIFDDVILEQQ